MSQSSWKASTSSREWFRGADIPRALIRRFARAVAQKFHPDKIILFGSYAYGHPHADSDVDILVIMPARNELDQAVKISWEVEHQFPLDLVVRTPRNVTGRLADGDSFLREIMDQGKILYEKADGRVDPKGGSRLPRRGKGGPKPSTRK